MTFDPYAEGALVKEHHAPLVARLDFYAQDAGIQPHWITKHSKPFLKPKEVSYLVNYRKMAAEGVYGLFLVRSSVGADPNTHASAIAAALVRNFIRARVFTLGQIFDDVAASDPPKADCLIIPNFQQDSLPKWRIGALYDLLLQRQFDGQQTVLYATDPAGLKTSYGEEFARFLNTSYRKVAI